MKIDELTRRRVEAALLDCDGSCRDINFAEYIPTSGALSILEFLASSWTFSQAMTSGGEKIIKEELQGILQQASGSLSTVWNCGCNPEHIQAYFHWDAPDRVFCELTFFPQDFNGETFTCVGFLSLLNKLVLAAHSDEYFLRYEDASWHHGQKNKNSVILSGTAPWLS